MVKKFVEGEKGDDITPFDGMLLSSKVLYGIRPQISFTALEKNSHNPHKNGPFGALM
jgi:hypothetical protein